MSKIAHTSITLCIGIRSPWCLADQRSEWGTPVKMGPNSMTAP